MTFSDLKIIKPILKAVEQEGYEQPSPIQAQAIPHLLEGRDLLGCAQTGTGKTAAFALPILQTLYTRRGNTASRHVLQALVLTPTRELAAQVGESFVTYGRYTGLKTTVIFGGVGQAPQVNALQNGVDVLVATPGRLCDLMGQGLCDLSTVNMFVLDEADRMLDMGFIHDVKRVIAKLPKERQTLLFSATMPKEIAELAGTILKNPLTVAVTPVSSTVDAISQSVYFVDKPNKIKLLIELLKNKEITSALVFTRTKHGADRVGKALNRANIAAGAIHGDKSQGARLRALADFKNGTTRVLAATDIAARGIDIDQLSHVINYDLPNESETYVHRIGRTGRAGFGGKAIAFCDFDEKAYLADIEKLIGKKVPVIEDNPYPMQIFEHRVPQTQTRIPRAERIASAAKKQAARQANKQYSKSGTQNKRRSRTDSGKRDR